jgi:hypothetical protein
MDLELWIKYAYATCARVHDTRHADFVGAVERFENLVPRQKDG